MKKFKKDYFLITRTLSEPENVGKVASLPYHTLIPFILPQVTEQRNQIALGYL